MWVNFHIIFKNTLLGTVQNFQLLSTLEQHCGLLPQEMGLFTTGMGFLFFFFLKGKETSQTVEESQW